MYAEKLSECNITFLKVGRALWGELMYSGTTHAFPSFCVMLSGFVALKHAELNTISFRLSKDYCIYPSSACANRSLAQM
jgi:hypothetical protein